MKLTIFGVRFSLNKSCTCKYGFR